jgi:hypothetical protein
MTMPRDIPLMDTNVYSKLQQIKLSTAATEETKFLAGCVTHLLHLQDECKETLKRLLDRIDKLEAGNKGTGS